MKTPTFRNASLDAFATAHPDVIHGGHYAMAGNLERVLQDIAAAREVQLSDRDAMLIARFALLVFDEAPAAIAKTTGGEG